MASGTIGQVHCLTQPKKYFIMNKSTHLALTFQYCFLFFLTIDPIFT